MSSFPTYGPLFKDHPHHDVNDVGREHLTDALRVLENRWPNGAALRTLPIDNNVCQKLYLRSLEFLKAYAKGVFETDNLKHVSRLIQNINRYSADLQSHLGVNPEHVKLIAVMHDLGKSQVPSQMGKFVLSLFSPDDFINTRVLPHEFYSMYWIQEFTREFKLPDGLAALLMDQIANHNFGPDLHDPQNEFLKELKPDGSFKHWWLEHWKHWAKRLNEAGVAVKDVYGGTNSPLAACLVLFDRIDGGHPQSWEKFLNQDALSGKMTFSSNFITPILREAHECAVDQVLAVGKQTQSFFLDSLPADSILEFKPIKDALAMLERSQTFIFRLEQSNRHDRLLFFKVNPDKAILYQDQKSGWFRIDSDAATSRAVKYVWDDGKWVQLEVSDRPIDVLVATIFKDWENQ